METDDGDIREMEETLTIWGVQCQLTSRAMQRAADKFAAFGAALIAAVHPCQCNPNYDDPANDPVFMKRFR